MIIRLIVRDLAFLFLVLTIRAEELSMAVRETWSGYWGGREATLHVDNATGDALGWRLAVQGQTLARGENRLAVDGSSILTVPLPSVKEGVVLDAQLTLTDASNTLVKIVHIFNTNVVMGCRERLESLHIRLFDPEGTTAKVFNEAGIPHALVANLAALDAPDSMLVAGEGLSLVDYPGLTEVVRNAAMQGRAVLCLAPTEGSIPLPTNGPAWPSSLSMRDMDIIREMDKRLDANSWPPDGVVAKHRFTLGIERQEIVVQTTGLETGWSYLAITYPSGGRVVWCAFDMVKKWQVGPAPQYLLVNLLEELMETTEEDKP